MHPVDLHRKVSRRSRPLCFAALLRRMTVFTTCWKCRKKTERGAARRGGGGSGGGGGGAFPSHVRTLVGPAFVDALSLLQARRSISFFLHDRHTRRLIKSATKSSSHHHRDENGPLTDSPAELLRDLLPRRFLSPLCSPFARFFRSTSSSFAPRRFLP